MEETYTISIHCSNCGYKSTAQKKKGLQIGSRFDISECPNCGCETVTESAYHEEVRPDKKDYPWKPDKIWMDGGDNKKLCVARKEKK